MDTNKSSRRVYLGSPWVCECGRKHSLKSGVLTLIEYSTSEQDA